MEKNIPSWAKVVDRKVIVKMSNGWSKVILKKMYYDPNTKNQKYVSSKVLGKLPPGYKDISEMVPTDARHHPYSKQKKLDAIAQEAGIEDTRKQSRVIYPLSIVFFVIVLATVLGYKSNYEIASFWNSRQKKLAQWIPDFPSSPISHDTVRRVQIMIGHQNNENLVKKFTQPLLAELPRPVIAMDGQACRAARVNNRIPYVLNFFHTDLGYCIEQKVIDTKKNEITYASEVIAELDISGAIITCDALNTQVKFAETIVCKGADYLLAVKENQPRLYQQVSGWFDVPSEIRKCKFITSEDDSNGRIELRTVSVLPATLLKVDKEIFEKWPGLEHGCIVKTTTERRFSDESKNTLETRYYISSLGYEETYIKEMLLRAIRQHWAIENNLHWVLDITFCQDRRYCNNGEFLRGMTLINKISYNILTKMQSQITEETGRNRSKPEVMALMSDLDVAIPKVRDVLLKEEI